MIADAADASLVEHTNDARTRGNAFARAGLVLLCGYFEGFLRDLAGEFVDVVNDAAIDINSLPEMVLREYLELLLQSCNRDSTPSVISSLRARILNGESITLQRKRFTYTGGNPTVDVIEELFWKLGIADVVDRLSRADYEVDSTYSTESQVSPHLRTAILRSVESHTSHPGTELVDDIVRHIEAKWQGKTKRRSVGYVREIQELIKKRNRIAHGEGYEQVTPLDLRNFAEAIRKLSVGLHSLVEAELRLFVPS